MVKPTKTYTEKEQQAVPKLKFPEKRSSIKPLNVSTSKSRVKCIFGFSKSSALAGFRFQKGVSYP